LNAAPVAGGMNNSMPGMVMPPSQTPDDDADPHSLDPNAKDNQTTNPRTEKK
jgi:hypothetical protein